MIADSMEADTANLEFDPAAFLKSDVPQNPNAALIILNVPISNYEKFCRVWKQCSYRLCADGGANRLYAAETEYDPKTIYLDQSSLVPDLIHGDLDSLNPNVREAYESMGVHVTLDDDQYSTDFGKAMRKIVGEQVGGPIKDVVVFGSLAGRVDQGIGLLHEMYREHLQHQDVRIWLYSETSMSFILPIGISKIQSKLSEGILTKKAGILPIYGPARITTTGFEWDVKDWSTAMGTQVSTSNHIIENEITVETDTPVLFTVQLDLSKNEVLPKDESFPT